MSPVGTSTILIMAGGTGGHVYPALAVAERLIDMGHRVVWLGVRQGMEASVVPKAGIELRFVSISGLRGKGALGWMLAPLRLSIALIQCLLVIVSLRPRAVMGMGGYVAGPGAIAAWMLRKPLLIHEQNSVAGFTNRVLARFAGVVMEAFPGTFPAKFGAVHTGNPVRRSITEIESPERRLNERTGPVRVLVLGGSQGALALNRLVPKALQMLTGVSFEVRHQAGAMTESVARNAYGGVPNVSITRFIDDMAEAYAWADLVVCRAGAMTIAELACAGAPSILVPFPHAVDDHQTHNALFLSEVGAAIVIAESEFEPCRLRAIIAELATRRDKLVAMAKAARARAMPGATEHVTALCMEAANG